jgi:hypothetical protein
VSETERRIRVERGAALLDERLPGWAKQIDLTILDLSSGCDCVLGQLALDLGADPKNFDMEDDEDRFVCAAQTIWGLDDPFAAAEKAVEFGFNGEYPKETPHLRPHWVHVIRGRLERS